MGKIFDILQKIGKSLMLPVSVLPAAGLLLRVGQPDIFNMIYLAKAGDMIFSNLPMIFAVGVAIGMANGEGTAALAAVLGEFILEGILSTARIGDMGVLGGITVGLISALLYNKYYNIKLPHLLGFFSGKRFVPIITSVVLTLFAMGSVFIWPNIQNAIDIFAGWASNSILGPAFYAAGKRLLIPVGLHHMYYPTFLFQFGSFIGADGVKYFGDSARYFHGDPTAGIFMASEYPIIMFGLPGAAVAMIAAAKPQNRKKVCGIMGAAALVAFITGITEPIEFSFIFVAPLLFVFHVLAAFSSGIITTLLHIRLGYTFSASAIDYALGYKFSSHGLLLWPIGLIYFFVYLAVFYGFIVAADIKTPGRDEDDISDYNLLEKNEDETVLQILESVGGCENIENVDACITRLRIVLKDINLIDESKIKKTGSLGTLKVGNSIQIIYGTDAEKVKDDIKSILRRNLHKRNEFIQNNLKEKDLINIESPMNGKIINITEVPDEIFSSKILGDGFAIIPKDNKVYSPIEGTVEIIFPTKHALAIKSKNGLEILVHIGIDTVMLNGEGFEVFVEKGEKVKAGDLIMKFDKEKIEEKAKSMVCPIVITNMKKVEYINMNYGEFKLGRIVAKVKVKF